MFDWMRRKSGFTRAQLREARLKRLAEVLEVPDQECFTSVDCGGTFRIDPPQSHRLKRKGDRCWDGTDPGG